MKVLTAVSVCFHTNECNVDDTRQSLKFTLQCCKSHGFASGIVISETRWPTFRRRYNYAHFLKGKKYLDSNFTEVVTGLGNGLAPKMQQIIIFNNDDPVHWHTYLPPGITELTHWDRVTHICVVKLTIIGLDNGLSPGRRQAITWTNVGILFIGPLGTNFSEMLIEIHIFSFMKIHLKKSSGKWRPFCLGHNVLNMCLQAWMQHSGCPGSTLYAPCANMRLAYSAWNIDIALPYLWILKILKRCNSRPKSQ